MVKPQKKIGALEIQGPKQDVIRTLPQVQNTKSIRRDATRKARLPGLRRSKNGNKYWETRSNRSDKRPNAEYGQKL